MKAQEFINEAADSRLKQTVIQLVQQTDDEAMLQKVYTALKSTDLETRIMAALQQDPDAAAGMLQKIAQVVIHTEGSVDEKMAFAENFSKGFVSVKSLFSGQPVRYEDFIVHGFPQRVFDNLVPMIKQGVGPGELAFSILSPLISFTGQKEGGGDLAVKGVGAVELKTTQVAGGRWINTRKAKMDMMTVRSYLEAALGRPVPDRVSVNAWIPLRDEIRAKNPKALPKLTKAMAQGVFRFVDTTFYTNALLKGTADDIKQAIYYTGWHNYKSYSVFDGMLIMSVPNRSAQYFTDVEQMKGRIAGDTPLVLGPESEMMPKIKIAL